MDKKEFREEFKKTLDTMYSIMEKKNADYAKESAFGNFELVQKLGITSIEKGILVRMADKMSRISTLIDQEAQVKDEAIEDTLQDLANYAVILKIYLSLKKPCTEHDYNYLKQKTTRTNGIVAVEYEQYLDNDSIYKEPILRAKNELATIGLIEYIHSNGVKQTIYDINDFIGLLVKNDRSN